MCSAERARRVLVALLAGCLVAVSLPGCAVAARLLTAAELVSAARDVAEDLSGPTPVATQGGLVVAVVVDTGGEGLRLNARPGADRIGLLSEGTAVVVDCAADGPTIDGPMGRTARWSHVAAPDGRVGYVSDAYLAIAPGTPSVATC